MKTTAQIGQRTWQITEASFNPDKLQHLETIHTVGNGYIGVRGTFEEGYPGELVSTLVQGLYDQAAGELRPGLVVLPNPLSMTVSIDGEPFHLSQGKLHGFRETLDLQTATLTRSVLWENSAGKIVQITFQRFASLPREHLLCQRIGVQALTADCQIDLRASIDGGANNLGINHWATLKTVALAGISSIAVQSVTGQSGYGALVGSSFASTPAAVRTFDGSDLIRPAQTFSYAVKKGEKIALTRYNVIHTTRDQGDLIENAQATLNAAQRAGYEALHDEHTDEWAKYWHDSDVLIDGDELAQRALRFSIYHILIAAPRHDEQVSIGAKTLSGPGAQGYVSGDTELCIVPLLTLTQPRLARNLLMYRYNTLQEARSTAKEDGYEGAMYPGERTEAADTGEETTQRWPNTMAAGTSVRSWAGGNQQHLSSDIAYAVLQYWQWTNDTEFFVHYGAEIVLDTAVFWGSRAKYNVEQTRYELNHQTGPDDYHKNINNSVFTNIIVRWHLQQALSVLGWLRANYPQQAAALTEKRQLTPTRLDKWRDIIDRMFIPHDETRGILEQFEGFFKLEVFDLMPWQPRVTSMASILGHESLQRLAIIKQADVIMLMALLPDTIGDDDARRSNWAVYSKVVDHGSSVSSAIHAWAAARLGLADDAYDLFIHGATIDLEDQQGTVHDGIHGAAAGGLWQAAVFGFAGLKIKIEGAGDGLALEPHLPNGWRSMQFRVYWHGVQRTIRLTAE